MAEKQQRSTRSFATRSNIWEYFVKSEDKFAVCKLCSKNLSYRSTSSNLRSHLRSKHPFAFSKLTSIDKRDKINSDSEDETYSRTFKTSVNRCIKLSTNSEDEPCSRTFVVVSESHDSLELCADDQIDVLSGAKEEPPQEIQRVIYANLPKEAPANNKKSIDECLVKIVAYDFQPFSIVEDRGFREYTHALNPNYELPSRKTLSNVLLPIMYEERVTKLKEFVAENVETICLTVDNWTSKAMDHYMAVTGHFLTNDLQLKSILLQCEQIEDNQNGSKIAEELTAVAVEWDILNKINLVVTVNASNMLNAVSLTGWNHIGCYAHQLNLIVQQALDPIQNIIDKVRRTVSHLKKSTIAKEKLQKYQLLNQNIEVPNTLTKSISTRWNLVYLVLERFVMLEEAIKATIPILTADLPYISNEEWTCIKQTCIVLKPFFEVAELMNSESYLTASLGLVMTTNLLSICCSLIAQNFHNPVQDVLHLLKDGMENQQKMSTTETNIEIALCAILDPRFKSMAFRNATAFELAKSELLKLSAENYTDDIDCEPRELKKPVSIASIWQNFDEKLRSYKMPKTATMKAAEELELYLKDSIISRDSCPLEWWRERNTIYPSLFEIYRKRCNIMVTSVPCERMFSKAGSIVSERRTRLTTTKIKQLMFLNRSEI